MMRTRSCRGSVSSLIVHMHNIHFYSRLSLFHTGTAGKNAGRTKEQIQIDIQQVSSVVLGVSEKIELQPQALIRVFKSTATNCTTVDQNICAHKKYINKRYTTRSDY